MSTPSSRPPVAATPADTDAELVGRARTGDAAAWEAIVRRHGGLVLAVARRRGLDAAGADDVVQEVFLALLRGLDGLANPQGLVRWLLTTAERTAAREARSRRRGLGAGSVAAAGDEASGVPEPADEDAPDALERLSGLEDRHRVRLALESLGERCRDLLAVLYGRGAAGAPSYDRVAAELGIPRGSIGPTRARCLARLLAILEAGGPPAAGGDGTTVAGEAPAHDS
jgi:RNA polymerase sigma factor (sigma-70 family)